MATNNMTKKENLIIPEVIGQMAEEELTASMKLSNIVKINKDLVGNVGDTVTVPKYAYIGIASEVAEGAEIPISTLTASTTKVTVKKAGNGVELTDEAMMSAFGDPIGEASKQLGVSIADKVETDIITELSKIKDNMTVTKADSYITSDTISDALIKFGDRLDGDKVLLVSSEQFAHLKKDPDFLNSREISEDILVRGTMGMVQGCQIVVTDRIKPTENNKVNNYIVKPEAIAIYLKREITVESERIPKTRTTEITADKHYIVHLANESKAIKLITKSDIQAITSVSTLGAEQSTTTKK